MRQASRHQDRIARPEAAAIIARDSQFVSPSYTRDYPFVMASGAGAVVEDVDGNVFLDLRGRHCGQWHRPLAPDVVKAITDQARQVPAHVRHDFYYELQVQLAEQIAQIAPVGGGTARSGRFSATPAPRPSKRAQAGEVLDARYNIIAFLGSFHGRTTARWP
jgi:4-aminobutyrate aminotransferase